MTIQVVIDSNLGTERLSKMIVLIFINPHRKYANALIEVTLCDAT